MRKRRFLWIVALGVVFLLLFPYPVCAYIDPGTTSSIFAILAPFITIFLVSLGFLVRPFRRFFTSILTKRRGKTKTESPAGKSNQSLVNH